MLVHDVALGDARVAVREWGPPTGTPLLFLHALGPVASAAILDLSVAPLVARGLRVVAPDQPGFGRTAALDAADYAVPRLADRAWALADALGLDRVVLGGHSWGGAIACHAAAVSPERVRALVLLDSGHLDYRDVPGVDLDATIEELAVQAEAARWRFPDRAALEAALEIDDPARRRRLADVLLEGMEDDGDGGLVAVTPPAARGAIFHHLARSLQSETWPAIDRAAIPTLLLLATEPQEAADTNARAGARLAAAIRAAEVVSLAGATHGMVTDLENELGEVVGSWLEAHHLV